MPGQTPHRVRQQRSVAGLAATLVGAVLAVVCLPLDGRAETLDQALAAAIAYHPTLKAEQARKRARDAGIDIAESAYYPRVTASGEIATGRSIDGLLGIGRADSDSSSWEPTASYAVTLEQPLFDGFRSDFAIAEAEAIADAASAGVLDAEQSVLLETVVVYSNVLRDRSVLKLRKSTAASLQDEVEGTIRRLKSGDATETDVAQARARHVQAMADLIVAIADAEVSAIEYERVVGHRPGKLSRPKKPKLLRELNLESAKGAASDQNPTVLRARYLEMASQSAVKRTRADGLPQLKLRASVEGRGALAGDGSQNDAGVALRLVVPLYDGGENAARVAEAQEISASLAEETRAAAKRAEANAAIAWQRLAAATDSLVNERQAAAEAKKALAGIKEGVRAGQRPVSDVLDAQRELVIAEIRVVIRERETLVASYALLAAAGMLYAEGSRRIASPDHSP